MPEALISRITSRGPGVGSGKSRSSSLRSPRKTTPFMAPSGALSYPLMARLGVDVGGTFTDIALWDEARQRLTVLKLPSVPADPAEGILAGIRAITVRDGIPPAALSFVAHGTTVATNALLEKKGARTALL